MTEGHEHQAESPEQDITSEALDLTNQQAASESEAAAPLPSGELEAAVSETSAPTEPSESSQEHSAEGAFAEREAPEGAFAEREAPPKLERLQKILAQAGIASRRHAEELITEGRVQVNGQVVNVLGSKADPARDHIRVDGKLLHGAERQRYFVLNKPRGFVTTVSDPEGRPTVMQFFAKMGERLYPVGRLDYLSEGLLLVTNDGDLANRLTKAASGVEKTYLVKVSGVPTEEQLEVLRSGVSIERGKPGEGKVHTAPARVRMVRQGDNPWYEVVLIEGRNRELRKMFEEIGHFVEKIRRVGYGPLVLDLEPGKLRELSLQEVAALRLAAEGKLKRSAKPGSPQTGPRLRGVKPRGPNVKKMLPKDAGKPVRYDSDRPRSLRVPEPGAARPSAPRPAGARPPRSDSAPRRFDKSSPRRFDKSSPRSFDRPAAGRGPAPKWTPRDDRSESRTAGPSSFKRSGPPRPFGSESPAGESPRRPDRPFAARPRPGFGERDAAPRKPFTPRPDRPFTARPSTDRPAPPPRESRSGSAREGSPAREGSRTFGSKPASGRSFGAKPAWKKPAGGKSFGAKPSGSRPPFNKPNAPRDEDPPENFPKSPSKLQIEAVDADSSRPARSFPPPAFEKPKFRKEGPERSAPARPKPARPRFDRPESGESASDRPSTPRPRFDRPKFDRPRPERASSDRPSPSRPTSGRPSSDRPGSLGRSSGRAGSRPARGGSGLSRPFTTSSGKPRAGGARPSNKSAWKPKPAFGGESTGRPASGSKPSYPSKSKPGGFKSRPGGASKSGPGSRGKSSGSTRSGPQKFGPKRPGGKPSGKPPRGKKRG